MSSSFNPEKAGIQNGNIFGFPYSEDEAELVIIPVPWEVTASYGGGSAKGPEAILKASPQLDFYDPDLEKAWEHKVFMREISAYWKSENDRLKKSARKYISAIETGIDADKDASLSAIKKEINEACEVLNGWIGEQSLQLLDKGKKVAVLGGDHSSALGLIKALSEKHHDFGILQIDAHADLRSAYEGFTYSHASVMHNALQLKQVSRLVQVGIRDISPGEAERIENHDRIRVFYDHEMKRNAFRGMTWEEQVKEITAALPGKVYVSYDIDGLDPKLCPNTGTPVPGGMEFEEINFLLKKIADSGRQIIGFDLCEVSPGTDEWDANAGARVLWKLCNYLAASSA